jgi:hypothetical protein
MTAYADSPRVGYGIEDVGRHLDDLNIRLEMLEQTYTGPHRDHAVVCAGSLAALPDPYPGDKGLAMDTGIVYQEQNGAWVAGGTIP